MAAPALSQLHCFLSLLQEQVMDKLLQPFKRKLNVHASNGEPIGTIEAQLGIFEAQIGRTCISPQLLKITCNCALEWS